MDCHAESSVLVRIQEVPKHETVGAQRRIPTKLVIALGLAAVLPLCGAAATLYVDLNSPTPAPPYTNWATAARTIQDAIDAAANGSIILVTNGIYASGGRALGTFGTTNRIMIYKPLTVRSVNGPSVTAVRGSQVPGIMNGDAAVRCAFLTNGAVLAGFTLTGGATRVSGAKGDSYGGGVFCDRYSNVCIITNCILTGNSAYSSGGGVDGGTLYNCVIKSNTAYSGGGTSRADLYNCLVVGNTAMDSGGGARQGALNNCTITANRAFSRAGGFDGDLFGSLGNCIVYYNTAPAYPNYYRNAYYSEIPITYCCLYPPAAYPVDHINITNEPVFLNLAEGDFRLSPESPCIDAGNNSYATNAFDLAGNPRILNGTVDIGAYECRSLSSLTFSDWLDYYRLPTDGSSDTADTDGDHHSSWQEWIAGTNPTNDASVLKFLPPTYTTNGIKLQWLAVKGKTYTIDYSEGLTGTVPFQRWRQIIAGKPGTNTMTFPSLPSTKPRLFRIRVE